ncbi:MAG: adenylate/guanylate cyclase domain-containing protein [Acidimicrobiia bacterium]
MPDLPTGTVTFLFTDLEGSTRLWEERAEAMKDALARHDELLRAAVEACEGHVVKTTGDGVHAAFADPVHAIDAAIAGQRALDEAVIDPPLRVRMGIHTGPAEPRDGDYYGSAVNRAARLMSAAHGGQIVVSLATEELVRDDLSAGIELIDLGEHLLRDLSRSERIFQVVAPGLHEDFAPLRSIDTAPGNLPAQLTSFIGRGEELHEIAVELEKNRLVTITGAGGVGKTRLAMHVAAEVLPRYRDGAWLCELAPVVDADEMHQVLVATLDIQPRAGVSLLDSICDALRTKHVLVILDNCEHLLRAARDLIGRILASCPDVRVLATSREGIGIAGEQVWPLRSLDIPESAAAHEVAEAEAAVLFMDRARSVRPGFVIDAGNAAAVADICRRLDGIPLALELAAARMVAMSPADVATRLDERFRLLTGGRSGAVERHQTLRGALEWSYSLLDAREQCVFDRLSGFSGTFDAAAAEAVVTGGGVEGWDVLDALGGLVAKSMLIAEPSDDGTMRYQLLETMRQYAAEQLEEHDDPDAWRRRHAEHYSAVTEEVARGIRGPDEGRYRQQLLAEIDNVRSAVQWSNDAADRTDAELGLRIIAALSYEASFNRPLGVGVWAERAAERAERSTEGRRSDVLSAAASSALARGDVDLCAVFANAALEHGPQADSWSPSLPYLALAYRALTVGAHDEMRSVIADWRRTLESIDADDFQRASGYWTWAAFGSLFGDPQALEDARAATTVARKSGNPTAIGNSLHALGMALARSDPDEALAVLEEAATVKMVSGKSNLLGNAYALIAQLRARRGERSAALEALRFSIAHLDEAGDKPQFLGTIDWAVVIFRLFEEDEAMAVTAGVAIDGPLAVLNNFPGVPRHGDPALSKVEARLGAERYRELVAQGAAMSYDEVVQYLFAEIDRMLAETS